MLTTQSSRLMALRPLVLITLLASLLVSTAPVPMAQAAHTPNPSNVTIAGSLQSELGCAGDWDPACAATHLAYDAADDVWQASWNVPAGNYEYKAALNDGWGENYGANATPGGVNIPLALGAPTMVKFYYDHKTHWVTDNRNSVIATAPGSYQSEIGCPGDWQPDCLRSWLQDPDGDGIYSFATAAIPAGSYEFKVALNESWDVNYGAGGTQNGSNIPFTVPGPAYIVTFSYNGATHVPSVSLQSTLPQPDNNVEWDGLRHDFARHALSHARRRGSGEHAGDTALPHLPQRRYGRQSTRLRSQCRGPEILRHDPGRHRRRLLRPRPRGLHLRLLAGDAAQRRTEQPVVPVRRHRWHRYRLLCGQYRCSGWRPRRTQRRPGRQQLRADGLRPGLHLARVARDAVIYQIFPDRFRNGRKNNDAKTGDIRYDDPVLALPWGTLPEGYCRNYADGATDCPWRFDPNPPAPSPTKESPRGRDYFGGDLKGVDQSLDYLQSAGINTIYFNPVFDAGSNHSYDTQDYYRIDPYFGTQKDWNNLVKHVEQRGMRVILDGVFNHMSSDSPLFDRYHHYGTVGACESLSSPYRPWFTFHDVPAGTGTCVGSAGPYSATYDGWFGFDSIPVLTKTDADVQAYFLTAGDSVSRHWLNQGAAGWRMDVMGDSSFPNGYWETFRNVVKNTKSDAVIISETWQKDSTLLRMLRGDRADTTMNYRLRDAVLGLLAPGSFDSKGFADSGRIILPSEFANRLASIREDYPDTAYYTLMNLVDSHDTERILWTLTPGTETRADKEFNAANLADGKRRMQIASLVQFTMPGAPTVYYGDEVGLTGDDDPDDRRTFPWPPSVVKRDNAPLNHYSQLSAIRRATPALTAGDFRVLLADDAAGTVAYGRKTATQAAIVVINRSPDARTVEIPVAGYLPEGTGLTAVYGVNNPGNPAVAVSGGKVSVTLSPMSAWLLTTGQVDLMPPAAPSNLRVTNEGNAQVSLAWDGVPDAQGYNVYRSPVSGGGWVKANASPVAGVSFTDTALQNAQTYYYVVRALDGSGNESGPSNEVIAVPHYIIGWANLQWPPTLNHTISTTNRTGNVYGQVWIDGVTNAAGPAPTLRAQLGFGPAGSNPAGSPAWTWVDAGFNVNTGNNDEFVASLLPETVGSV